MQRLSVDHVAGTVIDASRDGEPVDRDSVD